MPEDDDCVAVALYREEGQWHADALPERVSTGLDALEKVLRQLPGEVGAIGLVDIAGEFFVVVRVLGNETRLLLSDVTAAAAWDLARDVVHRLDVPEPGDDDMDDVLPAGDMSIFADLGLDEMELGAVLADTELYADEMLDFIAQRLGFVEPYERALDAAMG